MHGEKTQLKSLFLWDINEKLSRNYNEDKQLSVAIDDQPAMAVMEILTAVYCSFVKKDYEKTKQKISELHGLRGKIDTSLLLSENISVKVLEHVLWSTLYHVYERARDLDAAAVAFENIPELIDNPIDKATIRGCQAIVSSYLLDSRAVGEARLAIMHFSDCPLWHLLLYKSLRQMRMMHMPDSNQIWKDERKAMFDCTKNSNHPFYLTYEARMYEECGYLKLAQVVYEMAYEAHPNSKQILLKLEEGFINCREMEMAKACLDKMEINYPDHPMFLHHKGLYSCALKEYEEAAGYFEAAAACDFYASDIKYVGCKMKADKNFNHLKYLRGMLKKYTDPNDRQDILLHLGMQYRGANEFSNSCNSFVEAIEIDRKSPRLKNFKNGLSFTNKRMLNIFDYVNNFIPECQKNVKSTLLIQLKELCKKI